MIEAVVAGAGWVSSGGLGGTLRHSGFALQAGPLPEFRCGDVLRRPCPRFGRFDAFTRTGVAAVSLALEDAGLAAWESKRPIGIVAGTVLGCLDVDAAYYASALDGDGSTASPNLFAYTLPNCFLGEAAAQFGLTGPAYVLTLAPSDPLRWLAVACDMLADGAAPLVLAGVNETATAGRASIAEGAFPGAAFLVLASPEAAASLPRPLGRLRCGPGRTEFGGCEIRSLAALIKAVIAVGRTVTAPYRPACPLEVAWTSLL
jgi:3-oxoacyl-[acyl-carrier-protein] synthase II